MKFEITNYRYFAERKARGYPFSITFPGRAQAVLGSDPRNGTYSLVIQNLQKEYIRINKQNINIANDSNERKIVICLKNPVLCDEFFQFCSKIAIKVQNPDVKSIKNEILCAIDNFDNLLKATKTISETELIGLWGELYLILINLAKYNQKDIIKYWFGPFNEEHDFAVKTHDYEIKTTIREKRIHKISSLTQLEKKQGRTLFLVSIQITLGNGPSSDSVFSLISKIRKRLVSNTSAYEEFDEKIRRIKGLWSIDENKAKFYSLRSELRKVEVNKVFPKITSKTLSLPKHSKNRLLDCEYSINCENLGLEFNGKVAL